MSSIREQVAGVILTRLNDSPPAGVPTTLRDADKPLRLAASGTHTNLVYVDEDPEIEGKPGGVITRRLLRVRVECRAAAGGGNTATETAAPILDWITKQLGGYKQAGLIHWVQEDRLAWEVERLDRPVTRVDVDLLVSYQTGLADAESWT